MENAVIPIHNTVSRKGFLAKDKKDIWKYIADSGFNPIEKMIAIAQGELKCGACHGEAETRYVMRDDHDKILRNPDGSLKFHVRICESCYGSGYEHVEPRVMLAACSELAKKMIPDLKQMDPGTKEDGSRPVIEIKWAQVIVSTQQNNTAGSTVEIMEPGLIEA